MNTGTETGLYGGGMGGIGKTTRSPLLSRNSSENVMVHTYVDSELEVAIDSLNIPEDDDDEILLAERFLMTPANTRPVSKANSVVKGALKQTQKKSLRNLTPNKRPKTPSPGTPVRFSDDTKNPADLILNCSSDNSDEINQVHMFLNMYCYFSQEICI